MTIVEMREKRAKLWATMEGFLQYQAGQGEIHGEDRRHRGHNHGAGPGHPL